MVPTHRASARSGSRILRLDHIQRSSRDRPVYRSRPCSRDKSCLSDRAAGQPSILHSLTCESEQFCWQREPDLLHLSGYYERHDRAEPGLSIASDGNCELNALYVSPVLNPAE